MVTDYLDKRQVKIQHTTGSFLSHSQCCMFTAAVSGGRTQHRAVNAMPNRSSTGLSYGKLVTYLFG